jgi:cation transport ATPase
VTETVRIDHDPSETTTADLAIVDEDLSTVDTAFELAHAARRRIRRNNALALVYNVLTVPLAVVGLLNPLFVMAAVVVSGGLTALNSDRDFLKR